MPKKEIVLNLKEIKRKRYEARLKRLRCGYPLKFKRTRPRDPEKEEALLEWLLRVTPRRGHTFGKGFQ